jgi:hypothetical protein
MEAAEPGERQDPVLAASRIPAAPGMAAVPPLPQGAAPRVLMVRAATHPEVQADQQTTEW